MRIINDKIGHIQELYSGAKLAMNFGRGALLLYSYSIVQYHQCKSHQNTLMIYHYN